MQLFLTGKKIGLITHTFSPEISNYITQMLYTL